MAGLASLAHLETWRRELTPTPGRWKTALRITIACTVAAGLAQAFHLEQGFWAIVTILVLAPPTVAASLRKAAARLMGTVAGCLAAVAAVMLFAQEPPLHLAALVAFLSVTLYFALGTVSPYSFFVAAFTFAIIGYGAVPDPAMAGHMAVSRFSEISLGIIVSAASHLLLWPTPMSRVLRETLARKLRRALDSLAYSAQRVRDATDDRQPRGDDRAGGVQVGGARADAARLGPPSADPLADERLAAQLDLLDQAAGLDHEIHCERDAWSGIIGLIEFVRLAGAENARLASLPAAARGLGALEHPIQQLLAAIDAACRSVAADLEHGAPSPASSRSLESLDAAFRALDAAFDDLRARGVTLGWNAAELAALAATVQSLRSLDRTVERLPPLVADAFGATSRRDRVEIPHNALPSLLPLDHDRVRGAVKGAVAATIAIIVGSALHWRLGTPVTATCLVLAVTSSLGSFVQKSGLRLIGTLVGGAIALSVLLWVMPVADSISSLLALVAIVTFPCAWLLAGSDRVNYLGLQAAFAFSIGTLGPHQPTVDLWPPTSRMLGVFVGIAIFGLVTTLLWPVRATRQFRRSVAGTLEIAIEILKDATAVKRPRVFIPFARQRRLYDSISTSARLLAEAEYEDPGESRLQRTRGLELLSGVRRIARSTILWRQARWSGDEAIPSSRALTALSALGDAGVRRMQHLAAAIAESASPAPDRELPQLLRTLDDAVNADRAEGLLRAWPTPVVDSFFACIEHGRALVDSLEAVTEQARALAVPGAVPDGAPVAYASTAA